MPRDVNSRDAVASRVFARSHMVGTRDIEHLNRWEGGGGYFYEITDEGIVVTGKPMEGKGRVVLPWDSSDKSNLEMIDAILMERGGRDSKLGATYEPGNPEDPKPDFSLGYGAQDESRTPDATKGTELEYLYDGPVGDKAHEMATGKRTPTSRESRAPASRSSPQTPWRPSQTRNYEQRAG